MSLLLILPINRIHLIQCILYLLILLSTHVVAAGGVVGRFVRAWGELKIEVHSRPKLIYIDCVFGRLIKV